MIFADKLILLRKKNGWSQEELAEKLEVSRQTISKWEGALSVPDLGRMLKLSQLFGVTTDYLIRDDLEQEECSEIEQEDTAMVRHVSMEQAVEFLRLRDTLGARIALGVMLCIDCAIPLILIACAQELGKLAISENAAAGIGNLILFLMIALAVGIFSHSDMRLHDYEFLEEEPIETAYGVSGMVRERKAQYAARHTELLIGGIVLCVLCPTPLFAALALQKQENEWIMVLAVVGLLLMVGLGVLFIVRTSMIWGAFQLLLEEEEYTRERKREVRRNRAVCTIYWGLVTAAFLAYSFITNQWDRSWIIWPVAGVSYGVLTTVLHVLRKNQR